MVRQDEKQVMKEQLISDLLTIEQDLDQMMKQHRLLILNILAHATKSEQNPVIDGFMDHYRHSRVASGLNKHLHALERAWQRNAHSTQCYVRG